MKKLIAGITTAALIAVMSTSIFAAEQPVAESDTVQSGQTVQTSIDKKAERKDFRESLKPFNEARKVNKDENVALFEKNKELVSQIKEKLAELKASEEKLTEEQKSSLKFMREEVVTLRKDIINTKGQIKAIIEANKENYKDMDYEAIQAAYNEIYEIQSYRHGKLEQINDTLNVILSTLE